MAAKIRRDDEVIVLAGKDKGKRGKVLSVVTESGRVFVEGINLIKKHQKPVPQLNQARLPPRPCFLTVLPILIRKWGS